jgi:MSHA pilin protein MshC
MGKSGFDSRGFYDEAQAIVRFAQKSAIAWRRPIFVCISSTTITVGTAAGCGTPVSNPVNGNPLSASAPSGVGLTVTNFSFDSAGRPSPNATATITLTSTIPGDPARKIVVEAETGYVHQ